MKIIDMHVHFSNIESFRQTAADITHLDYSSEGFLKEFHEAGIVAAVAMGLTEQKPGGFPDPSSKNPMMLDLEDVPPMIAVCPGINPVALEQGGAKELQKIEAVLSRPEVVGLKIYAGYYPYHVHDKVYDPIYRLAEQYNLAVVIHSGVTYSSRCMLKYAHPLDVDEVAFKYGNINLVIAHLGEPWIMDAAVVVLKNERVYADLSGLIVADAPGIEKICANRLITDNLKRGILFTEKFDKILFGSDWPLAPVKPYIDFVRDLVPEEHHCNVFYYNALRAFPKLGKWMETV